MGAKHNEREFNKRWGDLANYNTEVSRGLVHTFEYQDRMKRKQELYNEITLRDGNHWTEDVDELGGF